jgi:hypothetical protein
MRYWILIIALLANLAGIASPVLMGQGRRESHPGCYCRDCSGGAQCCCVRANSEQGKLLSLTRCDRAEQLKEAIFSSLHWWIPHPPVLPSHSLRFRGYTPLDMQTSYRSVDLPAPPPRPL